MNHQELNSNENVVADLSLPGVIGASDAMRDIFKLVHKAARCRSSVLFQGETGTGKGLIAKVLHELSRRSSGPFVRVNCGSYPERRLESELFGHVRGSYDEAVRDRTGRFEAAHGGTIFLDEIHSASITVQAKILRILQERAFERVGDSKTIHVDVRVLASSNLELDKEIAEGRFREDLFWRLNILPIALPPLRHRSEDVSELVSHFIDTYNKANLRNIIGVHPKAMVAMEKYSWPGNVRELQNYIERAIILAEGETLTPDLLPKCVFGNSPKTKGAVFRPVDNESLIREFVFNSIRDAPKNAKDLYKRILKLVEKELLIQVLESCDGKQIKAADKLGKNRNTLRDMLKEHALLPDKES